MNDALALVLSKCEGVRKHGGYWMARCPAHDDREASLSVSEGSEHPVVIKCHAGCPPEAVLDAWGLSWAHLSTPLDERRKGEWTPHGEAVAVYDYVDETGFLLYQVCRTADKQFPVRVPDALRPSGYRWTLGDTRRVLYRLPKVISAIALGETVYVCEGEKDVHALERAGVTATTIPGGSAAWRQEYAHVFRDAHVIIIADADKPGRRLARQVEAAIGEIAASVTVVEAAVGKDAADHLAAGKTVDEFLTTRSAGGDGPQLAPDLHAFLAEVDPAENWVIEGLLEREDRLIWTGREGLGKSMAIRQLAICAAAGVHPFTDKFIKKQKVLFIDCENSLRKSRRRFRGLENTARYYKQCPIPEGGLRLIHRPEGTNLTDEEEIEWLLERVTAHRPDLLIIGPLYKLHTVDVNEETAARVIVGVLDQVRTKGNGCALVVEAHAPHGATTLRPAGSSLFLRWPDFGFGIQSSLSGPGGAPSRKVVDVVGWRGPREERDWPTRLQWGRPDIDWPWVAVV